MERSAEPETSSAEHPYRPGVKEDFDRLSRSTCRRIFATLMLILRNPAEAEDARQEAYRSAKPPKQLADLLKALTSPVRKCDVQGNPVHPSLGGCVLLPTAPAAESTRFRPEERRSGRCPAFLMPHHFRPES